jgi:hypothetical protein
VALRACRVSYRELNGIDHSIEVVAESLYHAVAQGLHVIRENDWVGDIGHGQTTIFVVAKHPEVEHKSAYWTSTDGWSQKAEAQPK